MNHQKRALLAHSAMDRVVSDLKNPALLFTLHTTGFSVFLAPGTKKIARVWISESYEFRVVDTKTQKEMTLIANWPEMLDLAIKKVSGFPNEYEHRNYSVPKIKPDVIAWRREQAQY